jgi:hypothetical protein
MASTFQADRVAKTKARLRRAARSARRAAHEYGCAVLNCDTCNVQEQKLAVDFMMMADKLADATMGL